MNDKKSKPAAKELSNKELDKVQGGIKKLTTKSTGEELEYRPKLDKAVITSYQLG